MSVVGPVMMFMQPAAQDFGIDPSGYSMYMMQDASTFSDPASQLLYELAPDQGRPLKSSRAVTHSQGLWTPNMAEAHGAPVSSGPSKAFDIKNPKTGKTIVREDLPDGKAVHEVLTPAFKAKWAAAAKVVAARMRSARWCADHSTFSALNVDGIRPPKSARAAGASQADLAASRHQPPSAVASKPAGVMEKKGVEGQEGCALSASFLDQRALSSGKISARAAANIAALSLEACTMRVPRTSSASATKCFGESPQEEQTTSAAESSHSLEASDGASGEDESSKKAGDASPSLGSFFQSKKNKKAAEGAASPKTGNAEAGSALGARTAAQLLSWRSAVDEALPAEIKTLVARESADAPDPERLQRGSRSEGARAGDEEPCDRALFGTAVSRRDSGAGKKGGAERTPKASLPAPSANAYQARSGSSPTALPRMEELRRTVQSLLNKICPENVATIAEQIGEVKIADADEMESIIGLIFKKALAEPHYCETYADLVFTLRSAFPEFPSPDGGKPISFKATLLNICQSEFEALPTSLAPTKEESERFDVEELEYRRKKRKDRVLSNMKLIGHLFLRQLLSAKVIGSVIQELTLCDSVDRVPEEHVIECAVELLMAIGYTLESMPAGSNALGQVCGRLLDLKSKKGRDGKTVYSKRIQFAIQDLLDTRQKGWARKVFSGVAKTKEEIRIEQEKELSALARGKDVASGERVVAGQRPLYLSMNKDSSPH